MRGISWLAPLTLLLGLSLGLLLSWVIAPVRYVDTSPSTLRADFKDSFRTVIAASYAGTHNLDRARARLALLGDPDPVDELSAQAQRMLASGDSFQVVRQVAGLASDLRTGSVSVAVVSSPTPATASPSGLAPTSTALPTLTATAQSTLETTATQPEPTSLPPVTPTARPTATPIPTASTPFQLITRDDVCNPSLTSGLMQVSILDAHHHQMPGVEIDISWSGGEEKFFTGLKPEIGDGYADYLMQAGVTYALRVARAGSATTGLSAPSCPDASGQTYTGGLKLVFQQP